MADDDTDFYIDIYRSMAGWKAQLIKQDIGPYETSFHAYATPEEAQAVAIEWGKEAGYPVRVHIFGNCEKHGHFVVDGRCQECASERLQAEFERMMDRRKGAYESQER